MIHLWSPAADPALLTSSLFLHKIYQHTQDLISYVEISSAEVGAEISVGGVSKPEQLEKKYSQCISMQIECGAAQGRLQRASRGQQALRGGFSSFVSHYFSPSCSVKHAPPHLLV